MEYSTTIAAIASPPGIGGIGVIRISGLEAIKVANALFSRDVLSFATHTVNYGKVVSHDGAVIDEVLLLVMLGPRSFTGEDVVEIHCHGGTLITQNVLNRCY